MGICDSAKNQNAVPNNTQTNITNQIQTTNNQTSVPETTIQNSIDQLKQNLNSNTNNNIQQNTINKQIPQSVEDNDIDNDRPSYIDRGASIGSSVRNEDSIGYNQTRNTLAV